MPQAFKLLFAMLIECVCRANVEIVLYQLNGVFSILLRAFTGLMKFHSCNRFINNVIIMTETVISWFDSVHYLMITITLIGMGFIIKQGLNILHIWIADEISLFFLEPPFLLSTKSGYRGPNYLWTLFAAHYMHKCALPTHMSSYCHKHFVALIAFVYKWRAALPTHKSSYCDKHLVALIAFVYK